MLSTSPPSQLVAFTGSHTLVHFNQPPHNKTIYSYHLGLIGRNIARNSEDNTMQNKHVMTNLVPLPTLYHLFYQKRELIERKKKKVVRRSRFSHIFIKTMRKDGQDASV